MSVSSIYADDFAENGQASFLNKNAARRIRGKQIVVTAAILTKKSSG
jgi:hypothetical protein